MKKGNTPLKIDEIINKINQIKKHDLMGETIIIILSYNKIKYENFKLDNFALIKVIGLKIY